MKPEFFSDSVTAHWPIEQMLVYCALWTWADDEGRFYWQPSIFRGQLFPCHEDLDVEAIWAAIEASGRIVRYSVNGQVYGLIPNFKKHQHPNRPQESSIPAPDGESSGAQGALSEHAVSEQGTLIDPSLETHCWRGREGSGKERKVEQPSSEVNGTIAADRVVMVFDCVGTQGKFSVTQPMVAKWSEQFPGVDVAKQLRSMQAWLDASPRRRKTKSGMPRFIVGWLTRQQDQHSIAAAQAAKSRWGSR